jgi:hypothetical protein
MTMRCEQLDDLLLEGDARSMELAAEHAAGCPACAETLAGWNEISATAATLRTSWPSDLLWPRIEQALRQEGARPDRRSSQLIRYAAAAALAAVVGGTTWFAVRDISREAAFDQTILRVAAVEEVERTEMAYQSAIRRLEKAAEAKLEEPETPLMVNYKEKLMLLDDAIAECRAGIAENRQNAHLRKELLAIYSEKQRTLQAVVREGDHVSNP